MPFTLAHPAGALPLRRFLGRLGVTSALAIGSMTPDLGYFVPIGIERNETHDVLGVFVWCIPIGLILYAFYRVVLRRPLTELLPDAAVARLDTYERRRQERPPTLAAVLVSLAVGACTHVILDAFTHSHTRPVRVIEVLRRDIFRLGPIDVEVYNLLQYGGSVLGLALIGYWTYRWFLRMPPTPGPVRTVLPRLARTAAALAILATTMVCTLVRAIPPALEAEDPATAAYAFVWSAVYPGMNWLFGSTVLYAIGWHIAAKLKRGS